jgi:glutathionylspermidine synthase
MSRTIEGCSYNPETHEAAFRFKDMGITVERDRILINSVKDKAEVRRLMDWLRHIVDTAEADIT